MHIKGLNKEEVLIALYNRAKVIRMGWMSHSNSFVMDIETARKLLSENTHFDYLNGKGLKINLDGDKLDTCLYNQDYGENAAEDALKPPLCARDSETKLW
jgi:hypothetical protein